MQSAAIFSETGVLDFQQLRTSAVRIPEVLFTLKKAQKVLDRQMEKAPDIINFLCSDDGVFWQNNKLRKIIVSLVQIGLYERHCKSHQKAKFLLGQDNEFSPVSVILGQVSLEYFVANAILTEDKEENSIDFGDMPLLSKGISMPEYKLFKKDSEGQLEICDINCQELDRVLQYVKEEESVQYFINFGPGQSISASAKMELLSGELNILESIDLDPMLSWFRNSYEAEMPLAN